jgi:multidrug efflux pump
VPLGIVVVGGLLFALVLTLFVIPSTYVALADPRLQAEPVPAPAGAAPGAAPVPGVAS